MKIKTTNLSSWIYMYESNNITERVPGYCQYSILGSDNHKKVDSMIYTYDKN